MKEYLHAIMYQLSNILYNASRSASKDEILDSIKRMLISYNKTFKENESMKIDIKDFRDKTI